MLNALFVIFGAALWATDTIFRQPMSQQLSAPTIVYLEHCFAAGIMAAWVLLFHRKNLFLGWKRTLGAFFIGFFGSAVATVLFTASFWFVNPTVSILLQKVQPILVILLSAVFLEERLSRRFWLWCAVAMTSAFFISFPHGIRIDDLASANAKGALLALTAAGLWAVSTVVGKAVLNDTPGPVLSFWRFFFGFAALFVFSKLNFQTRVELPFAYSDPSILKSIFIMALVPGVLGVTIYYRGLSRVPASVATLLELAFPLCAMWINSRYLNLHLTDFQLISAGILLVAMVQISRAKK